MDVLLVSGTSNCVVFMRNKVSVITVVYNDVKGISTTLESFFSQSYEDKELIVIDGGSTDGTVDIIRRYSDRIAFWCSEPDEGIYHAMNKGIDHVTGEWINILNSGDRYASEHSLTAFFDYGDASDVDVIYGNAVSDNGVQSDHVESGSDLARLEYEAIYRHGCSLMRSSVHRKFLYDVSKKSEYGFALDYDVIYRMYHNGCRFKKIPAEIQVYELDGASNNLLKSLKYNRRITTQFGVDTFHKNTYYLKRVLSHYLRDNAMFEFFRYFVYEFGLNSLLSHVPSWFLRRHVMKVLRMKIGKGTFISKDTYFMAPLLFSVGEHCDINRECLLDARGGIRIGNSVSISHRVNIVTGGHDVQSLSFHGTYKPIVIGDYAWLGVGCTILQDVTIGEGAVVCAGAVVTKDVAPYSIVAGIPAKKIGDREKGLDYKCEWNVPFT